MGYKKNIATTKRAIGTSAKLSQPLLFHWISVKGRINRIQVNKKDKVTLAFVNARKWVENQTS